MEKETLGNNEIKTTNLETKTSNQAVSRKELIKDLSLNIILPKTTSKPVEEEHELTPEESALLTDKIIPVIERGMEKLAQKVRKKLATIPDSPLKRELMAPFEYEKENRNNALKNYPRVYLEFSKTGKDLEFEKDTYFCYRAINKFKNIVAVYFYENRTLGIMKEIDENDVRSIMTVYHEILHHIQNRNLAKILHAKFPKDLEKLGKVNIIENEAQAYAFEIEILNLLMDGELEKQLKSGKTPDPFEVAPKLNTPPSEVSKIGDILDHAKYYYPEGSDENNMPSKKFTDHVAQVYQTETTAAIYTFDPNQGLIPYRF